MLNIREEKTYKNIESNQPEFFPIITRIQEIIKCMLLVKSNYVTNR